MRSRNDGSFVLWLNDKILSPTDWASCLANNQICNPNRLLESVGKKRLG